MAVISNACGQEQAADSMIGPYRLSIVVADLATGE